MKDEKSSSTKIKVSELKQGFSVFGNKGATLSNEAHIDQECFPVTLCGTPMLSRNYAILEGSGITEIGCKECNKVYESMMALEEDPFEEALYKDEIIQQLEYHTDEEFWKELCIVDNKFRIEAGLKETNFASCYFFLPKEVVEAREKYNQISADSLRVTFAIKS